MKRNADLVLGVVVAIAVAVTTVLDGVPAFVRILLGVPFACWVTGATVLAAVAGPTAIEPARRLLLTPAMSIVSSMFVLLVLAVCGAAITSDAIAAGLMTLVLGAAVIAAIRRSSSEPVIPLPVELGLSRRWVVSGLSVAVAFTGLYLMLDHPLENDRLAGYTELWASPRTGADVAIGVHNAEGHRQRYRVEVQAPGRRITRGVSLAPGGTWRETIGASRDRRRPQLLKVRLFRADEPQTVYREVILRA